MTFSFKIFFFSFILLMMFGCQSGSTEPDNNAGTTKEAEPTPAEKTPSDLLQGRWENVVSDKEFIIFNEKKMIRRFAGATPQEDIITNIDFVFFENCSAACQTQSNEVDVSIYKCYVITETEGHVCYKITKLDEESLEYTRTDGTGSKYAYKRVQ